MNLKERIKSLAKENFQEIKESREHLHAHPELSFEETETAKFISKKLNDWGIPHQTGIADNGIVALIKGENPDKKITALRADIDALPITEQNEVPYKSRNIGVMHACGHDVHTSSLLGTAKILNELKEEFEGTLKLIFQPAEEKFPGGASLMIKEGVLENPAVENIIGQHVMPLIPVGKVGFRSGMYMASADELYVKVIGKGGHGAMPEMNVDPVIITAHILVALQQIVSRHASPKIPSVLSFGKVIAEGATNVIPNEVYIEGTFRTLNEEWRASAHKKMKKMAEGMAESMGAKCEFEIKKGYPFLVNEPELTERTKQQAIDFLGKENVVDLDLWLAAEDFAYYSQEKPACFYRLGTRNEEKGITSSVHTPTFDIDSSALETGMGLMAWLAIQELKV
ncbi:N-acyl-L-amino acid amidohydrolase [Marivirga lumbricoides]|uniref:N-acyl-L-amino acid amidohydrolase n=1 Tax=Marivirga lumbricoides TaxID=1046115 RepID=A0ABQ1MPB3_9BACT|nr:N-acyl-L-amino acid amidohydrolase [Marivirga lumbricoides]